MDFSLKEHIKSVIPSLNYILKYAGPQAISPVQLNQSFLEWGRSILYFESSPGECLVQLRLKATAWGYLLEVFLLLLSFLSF